VPVPLGLFGFVCGFVGPVPVLDCPPPGRTTCGAATNCSVTVCASLRVTARDEYAPAAALISSSRRAGRLATRIVTPPSVRLAHVEVPPLCHSSITARRSRICTSWVLSACASSPPPSARVIVCRSPAVVLVAPRRTRGRDGGDANAATNADPRRAPV